MARKETKVLSKSIMSIANLLDDVQKESSFGLFTQVSPNLDSLAVDALLTDVSGKVKSHLTKKYDFRSLSDIFFYRSDCTYISMWIPKSVFLTRWFISHIHTCRL